MADEVEGRLAPVQADEDVVALLAVGLALCFLGGELELFFERLFEFLGGLVVHGALASVGPSAAGAHGATPPVTPSPLAMLMVVDASLPRRWPKRMTKGRVKK